MKPKIAKLYEKTPAAALATLAAGAFFSCDEDEQRRIMGAAGEWSAGRQLAFLHHESGLTVSILLWAIDCGATYGSILEMRLALVGGGLSEKEASFAAFMGRAMQGRLASLLEAMRQICADAGLDFEDVQRMAGIAEMALRDEVPVIPAAVAELVEQYRVYSAH